MLKDSGEMEQAAIVHLACHGRADADAPALSYLALSPPVAGADGSAEDGFLSLRELRDLKLRAELLVLSACETNAGRLLPFEGVTGFSRAALAAGARAVLSTLWQVEDEAALSLVVSFYRQWLEKGLSRADALAAAKRQALRDGLPLKTWAAYILWDAES